ncbi:MAG: COQ9 family protein [Alphaproteobacteria bacterium]|nr:COQ9 family protein [Alphaproteobacteria bacterium]
MTPRKPKSPPAEKPAILEAALKHIPREGFSDAMLKRAAAEAGVDAAELPNLFPNGCVSLIESYAEDVDQEMRKRLKSLDLPQMPVRRRIAAAITTRLDILRPHKDVVRRAVAFLSLPPNAAISLKLTYNTVDAMWRAAGDRSTDFNFYTKRAILAGVYSSTLLRWLTDSTPDEHDTTAFLEARIENVMQYERFRKDMGATLKQGLDRMGEIFRAARGGPRA